MTIAAAVAGLVVGAVTMGLIDRDDSAPMQLQSGRGSGGQQDGGGMQGPGGGQGERRVPGFGDGDDDRWSQDEWDHHGQGPGGWDGDDDGTDDSDGDDAEGEDRDGQPDDGSAFSEGPGGFVAPGGGGPQGFSGAS